MSELVMTVIAGPSHPNSGDLGSVHAFGGLYVGGTGAWRFGSAQSNPPAYDGVIQVTVSSCGSLVSEIRAGIALCLNIGAESQNRSLCLVVTCIDETLLGDVEGILDDDGWSVVLCGPRGMRLKSQWGARSTPAHS